MFNATALKGFVSTLQVNTSGVTAEAARDLMARTAERERARVMGGTPRPSGYRQVVDGAEGAPFSAVRPDGTIVLAFSYLSLIVREAREALIAYAPKESGEYIAGIRVFLDGQPGDADGVDANTREAAIVATTNYARRLEVGHRKSGNPFALQIPLHNVEMVARMLQRLYSTAADIDFDYVDLPGAWELRDPKGHRTRHGRRETTVRYPAIIVKPRSA